MQHAIIIGSAKSGTTSLYFTLVQHPRICKCKVKEPHWFAPTFSKNKRFDINSFERYEELWPTYTDEKYDYALEASTSYTRYPMYPDVARKIYEQIPDAKLIYVMRDPAERIRSHKQMIAGRGQELHPDKYYLDMSDYEMQLEQYRLYFNPEQILTIQFEDMVQPTWDINVVWDFLGVERHDIQLMHRNKTRR